MCIRDRPGSCLNSTSVLRIRSANVDITTSKNNGTAYTYKRSHYNLTSVVSDTIQLSQVSKTDDSKCLHTVGGGSEVNTTTRVTRSRRLCNIVSCTIRSSTRSCCKSIFEPV